MANETTLEKYDYRGCGSCPLRADFGTESYGDCVKNHRVHLKIKVTKAILWEAWNRFIPAFKVGDAVEVEGVAKDGILYCCTGESTLHSGVKDYMNLDALEILEVIE